MVSRAELARQRQPEPVLPEQVRVALALQPGALREAGQSRELQLYVWGRGTTLPASEQTMTIAPQKLQELIELFKRHYPRWTGFDDADLAKDEITYKRNTIAKAQTLLSADELKRLLEAGQFDEFISQLEIIGRDNNLLYQAVPTTGDLGVLYDPKLDKPTFCRAVLDLLYGPDAGHLRLTRYTDYVKAAGLPRVR